MLGTLRYASPEQLAGGTIDKRADLFALGLMVVEVITGSYPFAGKDATQVVASILHQPFGLEGEAPEIRTLEAVLQGDWPKTLISDLARS